MNPLCVFVFVNSVFDDTLDIFKINLSHGLLAVVVRVRCCIASESVNTLVTVETNMRRDPRNATSKPNSAQFTTAAKYDGVNAGHVVNRANCSLRINEENSRPRDIYIYVYIYTYMYIYLYIYILYVYTT